ncbi:MAG: TrmH family RNA methyltransferase [Candidatus Promineifilaceae bacterium]|jgi:RNA methyltransferase, TrmH family
MNGRENWRGTVERVRRAATAAGRAQSGYFSIEGIRLHERALRAGWRVETAVLGRSFSQDLSPRIQSLLQDLQQAACSLVPIPDEVMVDLTGGRDLGAIIGLLPLPETLSLFEVIEDTTAEPPLLLVAAGVKDPGNTGALMRTALASGATAFIACGTCDPFHPKAVRTSMGSLFKLPVVTAGSAEELLPQLATYGIQSVGLAVGGAVLLPQVETAEKGTAVVVGSEAWGLSPAVQTALDCLVSIPMREDVDSFSVNAAAAIALYEIGLRRFIEDQA